MEITYKRRKNGEIDLTLLNLTQGKMLDLLSSLQLYRSTLALELLEAIGQQIQKSNSCCNRDKDQELSDAAFFLL